MPLRFPQHQLPMGRGHRAPSRAGIPSAPPSIGSGTPCFSSQHPHPLAGGTPRAPGTGAQGEREQHSPRGTMPRQEPQLRQSVIPKGMGKGNRLRSGAWEGKRFAEPQSEVTRA